MTHGLHELPHPSFRHHRIISPVYLSNLPYLALGIRASDHGQVTRQRDGMIITKRELFPSLVHEVEDKFRVLAVLVRQDILALEDGGIQA